MLERASTRPRLARGLCVAIGAFASLAACLGSTGHDLYGLDAGDGGDATVQDAALDGDADGDAALDWLTVCTQYYAQPNIASSTCTDCENGACGMETVASLNACGDPSDSACMNDCKGATPLNESCTCLQGCLSAACQSAMAVADACQLSACGPSCN